MQANWAHFQCRTFGHSVTSPNQSTPLFTLELRHVRVGKSLARPAFGKKLGKEWFGRSVIIVPLMRHFGKKRPGRKSGWQVLAKTYRPLPPVFRDFFSGSASLSRGLDVVLDELRRLRRPRGQ
jgi:hypothetical protein